MFKNEKILAIIFLAALLIGELLSFAVYRQYSLFYQKVEFDEINHGLFSKLDPILGFTHNLKYKFSDRDYQMGLFREADKVNLSIPGFIALENKIDEHPVRIVVLGDSLSDPFMFGGNWPWQMHLQLKERQVSHIIYNGAISGYTSFQQINKLIRDVFQLEKIDLVIVYNGFNDFLTIGDIVPGHPDVNKFQKLLFDRLSGAVTFEKTPTLLPNFQYLVKRLYSKITAGYGSEISLGLPVRSLEQNFKQNIFYMERLVRANNIKFYHFIPPAMKNTSQLDAEAFSRNPENIKPEFFERLRSDILNAAEAVKEFSFSHSLLESVPLNQRYFLDPGHLNTEGNKFVASKVIEVIQPDLKKK